MAASIQEDMKTEGFFKTLEEISSIPFVQWLAQATIYRGKTLARV